MLNADYRENYIATCIKLAGYLGRSVDVKGLEGLSEEALMEHCAELTAELQAQGARTKSAPRRLNVRLRDFNEADLPFVISSWFESARPSAGTKIPEDIYATGMTARIARLSERARIRVACDENRPSTIYGWVCYEPKGTRHECLVIHYVYTLREARKTGVASALFEDIGGDRNRTTVITHANFRTKHLGKIMDLVVDTSRLGKE